MCISRTNTDWPFYTSINLFHQIPSNEQRAIHSHTKTYTIPQPRDPEAEALFGTLQAAVRTIRNARSEYNVELAKKIPATIVARDAAVFNALSQEAALIASLAKLEPAEFSVVRYVVFNDRSNYQIESSGAGSSERWLRKACALLFFFRN